MKGALTALEFMVINFVLLYLAVWVLGDYSYRDAYWRSMGFTPETTRYPLVLITSATRGTTAIPGTLTVDWIQVIGAILIFVDVFIVWAFLRKK